MGRTGYGYQSDPPLYSSPGAHPRDPRVLQASQDGLRGPSFESPTSVGRPGYSFHSNPPSYSSPSAHLHMQGAPPPEYPASRMPPPSDWRSAHPTNYGTFLNCKHNPCEVLTLSIFEFIKVEN